MFTLVVAAIFKNESHILKEWLDHYIKRGVEHFFLVNDASTDNFMEILKDYHQYVTLFNNEIITNDSGRQPKICNRYFNNLPSKWVAIIDLDEFIWSPSGLDITTHFNDSFGQIKIDWIHFGSSGHITQPESVVKSFTMRAPFDTSKEYYSYKTIYQTKNLVSFGVHGHNVNGPTYHAKHNQLVINHYPLQSFEFFMTVKATRGDVNNWFNLTGRKRDQQYFNSQDINEIEDLGLANQF